MTSPPTTAISVEGLSKHFGKQLAVDQASFTVPQGVVAGFIGPNGSGKTTTLRMLLSLVKPSAGTANVLGKPLSHPEAYLQSVGALIENPAYYPGMSARANLQVLATLGSSDKNRIDELLELVGLTDRANDLVRTYSLGMRQRLGIAAALLTDPALLILDEPGNGLDPSGIVEIRSLMHRLRDQGKTLLVSSHLLSELEQVADWLVFIQGGKILFAGATDELLNRNTHQTLTLRVEHDEQLPKLTSLLQSKNYDCTVSADSIQVKTEVAGAAEINRAAMEAGITLIEITPAKSTLEETFFSMTEKVSDSKGAK